MQEIFLQRPPDLLSAVWPAGFLWEISIILISFKLRLSEVLNLIIVHSYSEGWAIQYQTVDWSIPGDNL